MIVNCNDTDNKDSLYESSDKEDISLGSEDTCIQEEEIEGLEEEFATLLTPKKPSSAKKATKKSSAVDVVTDNFTELFVKKVVPHRADFYTVNWSFPHHFYSVVEGSKDILYTDFFCVNLPKDYIK